MLVLNGILGNFRDPHIRKICSFYIFISQMQSFLNDNLSGFCFRGFPVWLKYIPGISFRTDNEPFKVGSLKKNKNESFQMGSCFFLPSDQV